MRLLIFSLSAFLSILNASCTKEVKYTKEALLKKALQGEPSVELILPKSINDGVSCTNYSEGCLSGHTVKVKGLEMIAVEFQTQEQAIYGAKKIRGFYSKNWVFDDVTGEPILEDFVSRVLDAKKP